MITLALFLVSGHAYGQYLENYEKKAFTAFHSKDYASALLFSEKVLEIDTANISSLFVAGEAARLSGDFLKAEAFLGRIPDEAKVGYYAVTDFQLASVKLDLNKFSEAKFYFQRYLNGHNEANNLFAYLAVEALKSLGKEDRSKDGKLATHGLGGNVNTARPEFAPLRYGDKMYYTTIVELENEKRRKDRILVSRIFESKADYAPVPFKGNPVRQDLNAGNISLTPDASRVYYTLCEGDFLKNEGCEIWFRDRQYEGSWGPPKRMPAPVNLRGSSSTQPSIGWDKVNKQYLLYFASDRPGGRGGMDIWCVSISWDGNLGEPFCLPFNTAEDDITPFFHQASQTLFFSSNGWPGKGGFDVFRESRTNQGEWKVPENLGEMLNSPYDDTYYSFHTQSQNAYLVSNRPVFDEKGSHIGDNMDVFEARIFAEIDLKVFRSLDNTPVYAPQVDVKEINSGVMGSYAARNDQNDLQVKLETGKRYLITVFADGYEPYKFEFSTEDISYFIQLTRQIFLRRQLDP